MQGLLRVSDDSGFLFQRKRSREWVPAAMSSLGSCDSSNAAHRHSTVHLVLKLLLTLTYGYCH